MLMSLHVVVEVIVLSLMTLTPSRDCPTLGGICERLLRASIRCGPGLPGLKPIERARVFSPD